MRDKDEIFEGLARSKFRSRFRLGSKELQYLQEKGMDEIINHARQFIRKRLADAYPKNDGKQTPMKGHPVFTAQHATATCCRKCLEKWHSIETGKELSAEQIDYIVSVIHRWIEMQIPHSKS